jgi:hypothetical protein
MRRCGSQVVAVLAPLVAVLAQSTGAPSTAPPPAVCATAATGWRDRGPDEREFFREMAWVGAPGTTPTHNGVAARRLSR